MTQPPSKTFEDEAEISVGPVKIVDMPNVHPILADRESRAPSFASNHRFKKLRHILVGIFWYRRQQFMRKGIDSRAHKKDLPRFFLNRRDS